MVYRTPSTPFAPQPRGVGADFWREPNTYLEARAIQATDTAIVMGLKKLAGDWYRVTKTKYPKEYHVIVHDLRLAAQGKGMYLRVEGESKYLIGILTEVARLSGMSVVPELFDLSQVGKRQMMEFEKEAAIRWVGDEPQIRKVLAAAFSAGASRLDKMLLARFGSVSPPDVMKAVYFRGVAQGNTASFDSFQLSQDLYQALYE